MNNTTWFKVVRSEKLTSNTVECKYNRRELAEEYANYRNSCNRDENVLFYVQEDS